MKFFGWFVSALPLASKYILPMEGPHLRAAGVLQAIELTPRNPSHKTTVACKAEAFCAISAPVRWLRKPMTYINHHP